MLRRIWIFKNLFPTLIGCKQFVLFCGIVRSFEKFIGSYLEMDHSTDSKIVISNFSKRNSTPHFFSEN